MIPKLQKVIRSPWSYDVKPFHIVDNVYYVGNASVSSHLFDTGEGLLLLDTGYPQTAYLLFEAIRDMGFLPSDVRWILHSHAHIDHFGATRMFKEKFGCRTYMPQADVEFLTTKSEFNWCQELGMPYEPPYDTYFDVDETVKPGDVLTFGNTSVEVYSAAGHTPGTAAYRFLLPGGLKAAMHGGIGLNTLSREYAQKHDLGDTWRNNFLNSIAALRDLEVDVVLGNHPKQNDTFGKQQRRTEAENPFVDAGEWKCFLQRAEDDFRKKCL